MKYISITKYALLHHKLVYKNFLNNKTYYWPLVKTIINPRHECRRVYIFFDSEPYLSRATESNNQGIKVQVKRTFKSYSFLLQNKNKYKYKKKQIGSPWNFIEIRVLVCRRCLNPHFRINVSLFCCLLFFNPKSGSTKIVTYYFSALRCPKECIL